MPSAFDWNRELSWIKEYRFPLDQGKEHGVCSLGKAI